MGLRYLSKSKYMRGLSCPRLLWFDINQPEMIPDFDAGTQFRLDMGHEVGDLAKQLYPDGIEIFWGSGYEDAVAFTQETLKLRVPVFEATFTCDTSSGTLLSRADLLVPVDNNAWDMIEVKSSNSLKEDHYYDVAFQRYVAEKAGIKLRRCFLMHLNPNFRRSGAIHPEEILIKEDISSETGSMTNEVESNANRLLAMLSSTTPPDVYMLKDCRSISGCDLSYHCWDFLPGHHVGELCYGRDKKWDLLGQNISSMRDIPASFPLSYKQEIQKATVTSNQPFVDSKAIGEFLDTLVYPCYYMDFETIQTPIPLFDGLSPWAQLPFQYSVHKESEPGAPLESYSFLGDLQQGAHDPRSEFMSGLQSCLGDSGSIVAFNAPFEKRCLSETAATYQEYGAWVSNTVFPRIVDLITPFRSFAYYHPDQNGSCSLKKILPAITGSGYSDLNIENGGKASVEYLRMSLGEMPEYEVHQIRQSLEAYCARDTEGLAWIVRQLREVI